MDTFRPFSLMAQFELQLLLRHRILPSRQSRRGDMVRNSMSSLVVPSSSSPLTLLSSAPWWTSWCSCTPCTCACAPAGASRCVWCTYCGGAPRDEKGASMPHPQCQSCAYHHHPWLLSVVNIKRKEIYQSIFFLFTLFSTEISFPYWYKSFLC